jgi:histidyl-tRNA synthetase
MQKPSNAQGTRDFGPEVMRKRDFILQSIRRVFIKYGFEPIETPALENLSTLEGNYGEEGDKLLYKIRSNQDLRSRITDAEDLEKYDDLFNKSKEFQWLPSKSKLGLRYDLTIPFARFVVQHRNDITFPFRRYQIQQVWRGDRPAKGRYREFTQCDADCIGSKSLLHEADLIQIYNEAFTAIGLTNAVVKINHRKFLEALVDELKLDFPVGRFTSTLDKLDKIGEEGVMKELVGYGVDEAKCKQLFTIIGNAELTAENLHTFAKAFNNNAIAQEAIDDLEAVLRYLGERKLNIRIELDLSLARGLDYYTGCIFEAIVPDSGMGSISGGGRYDNLTGVFGLKDVSGVGISFGIDRIYEILEAESLWPENLHINATVLICHFDEACQLYGVGVAAELRAAGLQSVVYSENKRISKQLDYASKIGVRHVIVIGDSEMESGALTLKDLTLGEQENLSIQEIITKLAE